MQIKGIYYIINFHSMGVVFPAFGFYDDWCVSRQVAFCYMLIPKAPGDWDCD